MIISSILRNPISNPVSAVLGGGARNPWGTLVEDLDIRLSMVAGQTGQYKAIDGTGDAPVTGDPVGYIKSAHDASAGHMAATGTGLRPILQADGSWAYDGVDDTLESSIDVSGLTSPTIIALVGQAKNYKGVLWSGDGNFYGGIYQETPTNSALGEPSPISYHIDGIQVTARDQAYDIVSASGDHVVVVRQNISGWGKFKISGFAGGWIPKLNMKKLFLMANTPTQTQIDQLLAVEL